MNINKAKEVLSSMNGADSADPLIKEALEMVESNPELKEWVALQERIDPYMGVAVQDIPVPEGMEKQLLEAIKPPQATVSRFPGKWVWRAGIAAVLILGLGTFVITSGESFVRTVQSKISGKRYSDFPSFRHGMAYFISENFFMLDHHSEDLDSIEEWLEAEDIPGISGLPQALANLNPIGCKKLTWQDRTVSLVCFHKGDGNIVHMFILDRAGLPEEVYSNIDTVAISSHLETGGWITEDKVYLLVGSNADVDIEFALI